ncbi:GNAT family N-acetyltransferase [Flavobacterium sp.]|jgi:ribosomal protein S18 acetylase RimI-like enzyme|uniref:GNAT family N-acetyltransferase n=1 Tax=Flavobacterium sp. TaxID=239 RepID=UPI0037BF4EA7
MKLIQKIASKQTYTVRNAVLRHGKPIESCRFDGDDLETTTHFGLVVAKNIIGIVSIFQHKSDIFVVGNQYQIRGMAVLEDFQQKGFGRELILYCEKYILTKNGNLIWFNARENAVKFYEKLGYTKQGNPFIIDGIGSHYVMYKMLT